MKIPQPDLPAGTKRIAPQDGPQVQFLMSTADVVIYGGAAGGGKSWALLLDAAYYAAFKPVHGYNAVIFRRTAPQLKAPGGLIEESQKIYRQIGGEYNKTDFLWEWKQHDTIVKFAHMQYDDDMHNWQGSQIAYIAFDELTHFGEQAFFYMFSRNRSTCGVKPRMRGTVNPDPDSWVKKFLAPWVDPDHPWHADAGQVLRFYRENDVTYWLRPGEAIPHGIEAEQIKTGTFIPARLEDNPALMTKDPGYRANIMALDPIERERLSGGPLAWIMRPSGNMFKKHWFKIVDAVPAGCLPIVRRWDFAATEPTKKHKDPDYTCGVKMARKPGGGYIILDVILERLSPGAVEQLVLNTAAQDGQHVAIRWEQEGGSSGKLFTSDLILKLDGYDVQGVPSSGSKEVRARPLSSQAQASNIDLLRGAWNDPFLNQLAPFPNPAFHDDAVDAASGAYADLLQFYTGIPLHDDPPIKEDDTPQPSLIEAINKSQLDPFAYADSIYGSSW